MYKLVYKVRTGTSVADAVHDLIYRNVVELRKQAFGDDSEDAKSLPWNRAQAWKVVSDLAKKGEVSTCRGSANVDVGFVRALAAGIPIQGR